MFLKILVNLLTTEAAKQLALLAALKLAQRTKTTIDDVIVNEIAVALGVTLPTATQEAQ